jgi:transglutaminase-like putative cysteine protease
MNQNEKYLRPTPAIDCDNESIKRKAEELTEGKDNAAEKAKSLFYFVRDEIKYNLLVPSDKPECYRASRILETREGFCVQKAVLMAALARAVYIPARLHLAAIRNHLASDKLRGLMGGNVFPTHGYNELYIEDKWVKVAPTFDLKMCQQNRFIPVEFDGRHDAILPSHNLDGKPHIEYVEDRGIYDDLLFDTIINLRIRDLGADFHERLNQAIEARKARAKNTQAQL